MNTILPQPPDRERWRTLSFIEQMANISSEVGRTGKWKMKAKSALAESAFIRALDLIDATISEGRRNVPGRSAMLSELCLARELFCLEYYSEKPDALLPSEKYFSAFAKAYALKTARKRPGM